MFKSTGNSNKLNSKQANTTFKNRNTIASQITNNRSKVMALKLSQKSSYLNTIDNNNGTTTKRVDRNTDSAKKSNIPIKSNTKIMPANKIVIIPNNSSTSKRVGKLKNISKECLKIKSVLKMEREATTEVAIQTNENEILNHSLIVGDINILTPSKAITDEIAKNKRHYEMKRHLMSTRKFEEHSLQEEQHLDELREFLDKNYITRKHKNFLEEDRKIIQSMDELLQSGKPKIDSITDIKQRIKYKEQELSKLFNNFQEKIDNFGQI